MKRGKATAGMGCTAKPGSTAPPECEDRGEAVSYSGVESARGHPADLRPPVDLAGESCDGSAFDRDAELELIRRLVAGESAAMADLVIRYGTMLRRLIGRLSAWSSDVDDLFQEVLLRAWERAGSFRGGSLAAWLRAIAVQRCRNHFRGLGAWRRLLSRFRAHVESASGEPADFDGAQSDWIRHALQRLSAADRSILVLHYLEELSLDEMSEALGVRPGTLAVQLHRARERLRRRLDRPLDAKGGR